MRTSTNVEAKGVVKTGFDYDLQVWVQDYIVQRCGHPKDMNCVCLGRKYEGRDIRTLKP